MVGWNCLWKIRSHGLRKKKSVSLKVTIQILKAHENHNYLSSLSFVFVPVSVFVSDFLFLYLSEFPFSPSPPSLFPYILLKCGFWELNLILVLARQIVYRMNYLHNSIINEFWVFVKPLLNADSVVVGKWKFSYWFLWSSIWILASSITLELWKLLLNGLHQTK